jgi:cytochrome P450
MNDPAPDSELQCLPFSRDHVLDMSPQVRRLQERQPIARVRTLVGDPAWLVTGYEYVRTLFNDDRLGRSHPCPESAARITRSALLGGPTGDHETEKTDHLRMRKLLAPAFSARRVRSLEPFINDLVDTTLDRLASLAPPVDLRAELCFRLPVQVICELMGVPFSERETFQDWAHELGNVSVPGAADGAFANFYGYMREIVEAKRDKPGDDIISELLAVAPKWNVSADYVAGIAVFLLAAGHETTVAYLGFGILHLLTDNAQRQAVVEDPGLVPGVVEEILRIVTLGSTGLPRYAQSDIEIGGVRIRAGDAVLLAPTVANRDPCAFEDPDAFDVARKPTNHHLAFGYGPRLCPGSHLARAEMTAVFGKLFQRFPGLRLAVPLEELERDRTNMQEGLTRLPVTWDDI